MMKTVLLSVSALVLCGTDCYAQSDFKQKVRSLYQKAATEEQACEKLIKMLKSNDATENPLLLGYKGSATMMMANHVFSPFTKFSYFEKGKKMLEKAVEADNENVELRFLRYAAQKNAPSFLGYDNHIVSDKRFILQSSSRIDDTLKELISSQLDINQTN